jgi:hypothetical protein
VQPQAIAPQGAVRRAAPVQKTKPSRTPQPGDLVCGECGESNSPSRKFCSRCGSTLATATVVKIPWWRKFVPHRKAKTMAAGERPWKEGGKKAGKQRRPLIAVLQPLMRFVAIGAVVVGLIYGVYAPFRGWVNDRVTSVKDKVNSIIHPTYDAVRPNAVTASSAVKDHPATAAIDLGDNTFWETPPTDKQPTITLKFPKAVDLDRAFFTIGIKDNFASQNRPATLHLVYSTGKTADVTLKDSATPQQHGLSNGHGITTVAIHVTSMFKSIAGKNMAFTEIELFTKH